MISSKPDTFKYQSPIPISPGDTISEILAERGIKQAELAKRMGRPLKAINEMVKGKSAITVETALQLEQVLGVPAKVWLNLESNYQEVQARLKADDRLGSETEIARNYPYAEMAGHNWVPDVRNVIERTKHLLSFFGVTSLNNIIEAYKAKPALYRISNKSSYSFFAIVAWLRKGLLDAQSIPTENYDEKRLRSVLSTIRAKTLEKPEVFEPQLKEILSGCGIAFVVTPGLKKAPVNGASRWITPEKALIQLSLRYSFSDIFWFSLFHEIGHILLHGKKDFNIDIPDLSKGDEKEEEANKFACDTLIPEDLYKVFVGKDQFGESDIKLFSHQIGIHTGIVVGRLQREKRIAYQDHYKLKSRFKWTAETGSQ